MECFMAKIAAKYLSEHAPKRVNQCGFTYAHLSQYVCITHVNITYQVSYGPCIG